MKRIIFWVVVIFGVAANANCDEIIATITKTSHNTIVTCSPPGDEVIEKAYLSLYASKGQPYSFIRREMNVSFDNTATYILRGPYNVVEGKCQFVLADKKILRKEFLASIK